MPKKRKIGVSDLDALERDVRRWDAGSQSSVAGYELGGDRLLEIIRLARRGLSKEAPKKAAAPERVSFEVKGVTYYGEVLGITQDTEDTDRLVVRVDGATYLRLLHPSRVTPV